MNAPMSDENFRCGHNFPPRECPYPICGYRSTLQALDRLGGAPALSTIDCLSKRETEVFYKIAEGKRGKEIAAALGLSPKTIDTFRSNIYRKLHFRSVSDLIRFAVAHNL